MNETAHSALNSIKQLQQRIDSHAQASQKFLKSPYNSRTYREISSVSSHLSELVGLLVKQMEPNLSSVSQHSSETIIKLAPILEIEDGTLTA